jgi:hypothetical protein
MDKVECVTVQVPWSHSFGGETKGSFEVVDALVGSRRYLDGARRLMEFDDDTSVEAAAGAVVVIAVVASSAIIGKLNGQKMDETRFLSIRVHEILEGS